MIGFYNMSLIGTSHQLKEDGICQDANGVKVLDNGWVVAVIADGIGSAAKSNIGATIAVETVLSFISDNCLDQWHTTGLKSLIRVAYHKAMKAINVVATENGDDISEYDTTLTTVIYNGVNLVYGHVGDGGIIVLSPFGTYSQITKVQKGESYNETYVLRSSPDAWDFGVSHESVCAFVMVTDGILDVMCPPPLAKTDQPIYIRFVRPFIDINVLQVKDVTDFEIVQSEVGDYFRNLNSRIISDDKTIVGVINLEITPEVCSKEYYQEPDWKSIKDKINRGLYGYGVDGNFTTSEKIIKDFDLVSEVSDGGVSDGGVSDGEVSAEVVSDETIQCSTVVDDVSKFLDVKELSLKAKLFWNRFFHK